MNFIKRKALLLGMLANLTTLSLTGCGYENNKIANTNIEITWENDTVTSGTVPYDDIYGNIKVVILEQNGTIKPFFMIRELRRNPGGRGSAGNTKLSYIDLKTGITMIQYSWIGSSTDIEAKEPDNIPIGKYLTILEEKEFYDYLFGLGEIRSNFDINEIVDIYNNEIEPQLIEYINEEYNSYTKK